jgi:hypothetical protein
MKCQAPTLILVKEVGISGIVQREDQHTNTVVSADGNLVLTKGHSTETLWIVSGADREGPADQVRNERVEQAGITADRIASERQITLGQLLNTSAHLVELGNEVEVGLAKGLPIDSVTVLGEVIGKSDHV